MSVFDRGSKRRALPRTLRTLRTCRTRLPPLLCLCVSPLLGCAGDDPICIPTDVQVCSCGTLTGTRVCNADGTGWTACSCAPVDADADADVDAREDWTESDGGDGETVDDGGTETDVPPPPPCNELTFTYRDAAASTVWVSGTFNGWPATAAAGALELTRSGADLWSVTTLITPFGRHEYKLVIDGVTWIADPDNPDQAPDGYGRFNSVLYVCEETCDPAVFDWRDAVLYFVMTDRFFDSDGRSDPVSGASGGDARVASSGQYEGGDLAGVTDKMGYLADLGVTAIWLSAPYDNRDTAGYSMDPADTHVYSAYHGYWPKPEDISYADPANPTPRPRVESRIGTEADLVELVSAAHAAPSANGHGIKVLFDFVMKHVDLESGLYLGHWGWFARDSSDRIRPCGSDGWDDPYWGTRCAFADYLPPFDFYQSVVRDWSVNDALWWATEFDLDGYRLDAIKHVPFEWLTELRARLDAAFPAPDGGRFYLVGETYTWDGRDTIRSFVNPDTMLDGQFDFPLKARLCEAVFTPGGGMNNLASFMDGNDFFYGAGAIMSTFLGNHDVPRVIHHASRQLGNCREGSWIGNSWTSDYPQPAAPEPYERLGVAFAVLMTSPGIPLIYYGDEIGLAGGGDPDNRRLMPWADSSLNPGQLALRNHVSALAHVRATHPVLGRGRRETISSDQDTWVFRMTGCGDGNDVVVAVNRADSNRSVSLPPGSYTDLLDGGTVAAGSVSLDPRSFLVLGEP